MNLSSFYIKFLNALNKYDVEYLVVGGQAVNAHGYVRATMDMDIWINKTTANLERLKKVFIFMSYDDDRSSEAIAYFLENHKINIPKNQNLIEILDDSIVRADFNSSFAKKSVATMDKLSFFVIDIDTLIEIKSGSGRLQDLADAEKLKEIRGGNALSDSEEGYTLE
ncbi:MAG: hypothetical protein K9J30_04565 [Bacteroidales bacterium]|nr:hypothetical protein [Bacteroidales bacterium]